MIARLLLVILAICPAPSLMAQTGQPAPGKRIVFVCEHGSVKSLIAASYFNRSARARGLPFEAVARGTAPQPTVPRTVQDGLNTDGLNVSGFVPQLFRDADLDGATLVVSFDQDITALVGGKVPHLKWDHLPGVLADYSRGRNAIVRKLDTLIDQLVTAPY
jgi:arsenate reductase (thioredoxin)